MPSVDQLESVATEMATLTNTLEMFDTYKPQENEKDSDDESFHLPLLDCDDDGKESTANGKSSPLQNGETEDDILNKFETTSGTPDCIDPKVEESLLEDVENSSESASKKEDSVPLNDTDSNAEKKDENVVINSNNSDYVESSRKKQCNSEFVKPSEEDEQNIKSSVETPETEASVETPETEASDKSPEVDVSVEAPKSEVPVKTPETEVPVEPALHIDSSKSTEELSEQEKNEEEEEKLETDSSDANVTDEKDQIENEITASTELGANKDDKELDQNKNQSDNNSENETVQNSNETDPNAEEQISKNQKKPNSNTIVEDVEMKEFEPTKKMTPNDTESEAHTCANDGSGKNAIIDSDKSTLPETETEKEVPDNCENSNDSSKSQNLDSEDLFDISIVRDVDEDNASAIEEINKDQAVKSDDDENSNDKMDQEDVDMEASETTLKVNESEHLEFEDDIDCDKEQDHVSDTSKTDVEMKEDNNLVNSGESASEHDHTVPKSTKTDIEKLTPLKEEQSEVTSGKRSLSETDSDELASKKIKLSETVDNEKEKPKVDKIETKTLLSFASFMQNKKLKNKLTRSDLEQFCLQKICEAIMHKTDIGELLHQYKQQEQTVENLRKEVQALSKQTRDLEIVNKKLMGELRLQNGSKKPLVPLKITRSVGLQVKLNTLANVNVRPRPTVVTPQKVVSQVRTTPQRVSVQSVVRQVATQQKPTLGQQTQGTPGTPLLSQALQNRRLAQTQNSLNKRTLPIRPKPNDSKPTNSVIDLTDEDDKSAKTANKTKTGVQVVNQPKLITVQSKVTPNKVGNQKPILVQQKPGTPARTVTTLPQGVRLTSTQVKNGSITLPAGVVTSSSPQLMYVVQPSAGGLPQGIVTTNAGGTQKAVLVNFQPTNGVLTQTLNGSSVSVIPKTGNTVQLKPITMPTRKHPAPLPTPPLVRVNSDIALKPVPPKPHLSIRKTDNGIILQWKMPYNLDLYESIASYQLYAYQETNAAPTTDMWRRVGDVKALALPMACTLTQFADKNKYYFAVRTVDVHKRIGAFSDPEEIAL